MNRNSIKLLIKNLFPVSIISFILLSSCEKVVDVKLKNALPRLVIEGFISDEDTNHTVRISRTILFTDSDRFEGVPGAKVMLTAGDDGPSITFTQTSAGVYKSSRFPGVPGTKYILDVEVEGKNYTAASEMPSKVRLDSISFKRISFFGDDNIFPVAHYKDPRDVGNQFFFRIRFKDREPHVLTEDRFSNGNNVTETLFFDSDDVAEGDSLEVEMRGIDRNVYRYFFALAQIEGEGGPPVSPANPESNFNNGALGVFSAFTSSKIMKVVKVR